MVRDRYEVAIHSPAGYLGNSVRKFWLNGSRPIFPVVRDSGPCSVFTSQLTLTRLHNGSVR